MKREMKFVKSFLRLVEKTPQGLPGLISAPPACRNESIENFCEKYPAFDFKLAEDGANRDVILFSHVDVVLKVGRWENDDDLEIERKNYKIARDYGMNKYFLPTKKIPTKWGTVYVQKQIQIMEDIIANRGEDYDSGDSYWGGIDLHFLIEAPPELTNYIKNWSRLNDLHTGNYGYSQAGNLLITDYSI